MASLQESHAFATLAGASALMIMYRRAFPRCMPRLALRQLPPDCVPAPLTVAHHIDIDAAEARGFEHADFLRDAFDVVTVIDGIERLALDYLYSAAARARSELCCYELDLTAETSADMPPSPVRCRLPLEGTGVHDARMPPNMPAPVCAVGRARLLLDATATFAPERVLGTDAGAQNVIVVGKGAVIEGGTLDVRHGAVYIGPGAVVEPGALVRGPAVVGAGTTLRRGAYLRGPVVLGSEGTFGCELKNVLACDGCDCPHHGYIGDSLLGHKAHLGCGAATANFPLFAGSGPAVDLPEADRAGAGADGAAETANLVRYELGRRKFGAVIGDGSQLGCGCVTEPGCLIGPNTHAYPLCRLPRGAYGPDEILKRGAPGVARAPMR